MKSYTDIRECLAGKSRPEQYLMLLQTTEWENFRRKILDTYGRTCELCQASEEKEIEMPEEKIAYYKRIYDEQLSRFNWREANYTTEQMLKSLLDGTYIGRPVQVNFKKIIYTTLQIHHKLYLENKLPWQYKKTNVMILCSTCHSEVHRSTKIYTYRDESMSYRKEASPCERCLGTGYLPQFYYHDNGICYDCGGLGLWKEDAINGKQSKFKKM